MSLRPLFCLFELLLQTGFTVSLLETLQGEYGIFIVDDIIRKSIIIIVMHVKVNWLGICNALSGNKAHNGLICQNWVN